MQTSRKYFSHSQQNMHFSQEYMKYSSEQIINHKYLLQGFSTMKNSSCLEESSLVNALTGVLCPYMSIIVVLPVFCPHEIHQMNASMLSAALSACHCHFKKCYSICCVHMSQVLNSSIWGPFSDPKQFICEYFCTNQLFFLSGS